MNDRDDDVEEVTVHLEEGKKSSNDDLKEVSDVLEFGNQETGWPAKKADT